MILSTEARAESHARRLRKYPDAYLRMPLSFGPFPGPRQTEAGFPHSGWPLVSVRTAAVTFKASKAQLSSYLPHESFRIDDPSETSFASLSLTSLDNLPWLAEGGYHHYGLYIHDVVCEGKTESIRGKYLVVLFENRADPITSGREELGFSKLFASLEDELDVAKGRYELRAGWEGTSFGKLRFEGLTEIPINKPPPQTSLHPPEGLLHFKYVPATGRPGHYDVQYPTFSPNAAEGVNVVQKVFVADSAAFEFEVGDAKRLPTLSHVVAGLAEIEPTEIVDARVIISEGQSDIRNQIAISI